MTKQPEGKIIKIIYKNLLPHSNYSRSMNPFEGMPAFHFVNSFVKSSKSRISYEDTCEEIASSNIPLDTKMLAMKALMDLQSAYPSSQLA